MSDQTEFKAQVLLKRGLWVFFAMVAVVFAGVWTLNSLLVGQPVQKKLNSDPRNQGYALRAHFGHYINPSTLVLDLREAERVAPVDLFRALFQSAEAFHESGRKFDKVLLARGGTPVFLITGNEFAALGAEYSAGQNPVYLIRTLPEKLYRPSGEAAFGRWEGGWLGVLTKQMEDANNAAQQWASGQ
jgi:hypothetical protein